MAYTAKIKDNETEESREIGMHGTYVEHEWVDGDYRCDCMRHVIFNGDFADEHPCGNDRYELEEINIKKEDLM